MAYAKPVLRVKKKYQHLEGRAPIGINANILTQGFSGGQRHVAHDWVTILRDWGYVVNEKTCTIYNILSDDLVAFHGLTLRDALKEAKKRYPYLANLYRATGKDPVGDTQSFVESRNLPKSATEYLFGPVSDEHREEALNVSRYFRRALGRPLNEATKWSQTEYGIGYVAYKFPVVTDEDVYHPGAGGWFGQSFRGIKTSGTIRQTDPIRDGSRIELDPPENVCVSDCSYGDGDGMSNVQYFYSFYQHWINKGKKVYFKGDLCHPPNFPCKVLSTTRPHNREFIGYADSSVTDVPDYASFREQMHQANVARNTKSLKGDIKIPDADVTVIEDLLYTEIPYNMTAPRTYDYVKRIAARSRFPVSRPDFLQRMNMSIPGRAFTTVSASIFAFVMASLNESVKKRKKVAGDEIDVSLDLTRYPSIAAHTDVEEIVWGFERCAAYLGIKREGTVLVGPVSDENRSRFLSMLQDFVVTA
jgi:hypothetical protein